MANLFRHSRRALRPALAIGIASLWSLSAASDPAPRLVLTRADGATVAYYLDTIRRLDVEPGTLVVLGRSGGATEYPFASLRDLRLEPTPTTSIDDPLPAPALELPRLLPGYPNPAHRTATLPFALARRAHVTLEVYAVSGQRVRTLIPGELAPGTHEAVWDGNDDRGRRVRAGVYFYRLRGAPASRRVTLLP